MTVDASLFSYTMGTWLATTDRLDDMFLIAGIQPKTKRLSDIAQRCPSCGLTRAYTTRIDHYLSLFFIPLIKVKEGASFLSCEGCSHQEGVFQANKAEKDLSSPGITTCVNCKQPFHATYRYCPHCGQRHQ